MKTQIVGYLQNILGITALRDHCQAQVQARVEAEGKLAQALKQLEEQAEGFLTERDIENMNLVTERDLEHSIEDSLNDQDWGSIVSDALSERHCSSVLDDIISEIDFSESRSFTNSVQDSMVEILRNEAQSGDDNEMPVTCAVQAALATLPVA